jgi:TolC family type I secretion outer membrane protein
MFRVRKTGIVLIIILITGAIQPGLLYAADFTLEDAYNTALKNNEQIAIAGLEVEKSKNEVTVASSALLPRLSLSGESIRQKEFVNAAGTIMTDKTNNVGRAELSLHLYQGGKPWFDRRGSILSSQAEQENYFRTRQRVLFGVARAYYQVLLSRKNKSIASAVHRRANNQLQRAKGLFEVGEITRTGVLRARVQVSQAVRQLEEAKNELAVARDNLAHQLGVSDLPGEIGEPQALAFADTPVEGLIKKAYNQRQDLEAIKNKEKAAIEAVKARRASWFPKIDLVSSYETFEEERYAEDDDWRVMAQGSYPLFSGWRDTARIEKSEAQQRQAALELREAKRSIRIEVREAYFDLKTRKEVMNSLRQQVKAARRNYEEISAQFEESLATSLDVSDAHDVLKETQLAHARSYYSYQLEILALKLATGTFKRELL